MKFLVFQHIENEYPGFIAPAAKDKGIALDTVEFWKQYKIPPLSNYDGLIIMGGPMGVYDGKDIFPSKEDEVAIIKKVIGKIPILGICLGSQLIAFALGAAVHKNIIDGKHIKEIGYYDINLTADGKNSPLFKGIPAKFNALQWHGDAFELPKDAKPLATSPLCANQAFSRQNAYGLLFHLEFTPQMVERQIKVDKKWIHKDFEIDEEKLLKEAKQKEDLMRKQSVKLLNNFLTLIK